VLHGGACYPHYGRFLDLVPTVRIEMTWVTGAGGTKGAETVVKVELAAIEAGGTQVSLSHSGFYEQSSADATGESWPAILEHLDSVLTESQGAKARPGR
jgi:uncharacterized protein YndB with AHSA1/START domain